MTIAELSIRNGESTTFAVGEAYLCFRIERTGRGQTERVVEAIREAGYDVTVLSDL